MSFVHKKLIASGVIKVYNYLMKRLIFHIDVNNERDEKLDKTLDSIRGRFGSGIVQRGTVMGTGLNVARKFNGEKDKE